MTGSRICMSKDIDIINSLLSVIHFASLDGWEKNIKHTCVYNCVLSKEFEPESFQLNYNPPTFEYKIHSY